MFEQVAASVVIALFVATLVTVILRKTVPSYGGARSWADFQNYAAPEGVTNWISPALVLVALTQLGPDRRPVLGTADVRTWCIVSAIAGLVSLLMARPILRAVRDTLLSLCAVTLAGMLLWQYILESQASPLPAAAMFVILALTFLMGVILNILRMFNIPRLGLAGLGAVEILLFLIYPFNIEILLEIPIELSLILFVISGLLGAAAAAASSFLIPLAGIAICAAEVGVNVFLWVSAEGRPSDADWTGTLVIIGTQAGVALGLFLRGLGPKL